MTADRNNDIKQLNSFLRGELSAIETYGQAIEKVDDASVLEILRRNVESHQWRANALRQRVRSLGGEPSEESGAWGAFARAVEGGAALLGTSAAVAVLEEGEDHGLADYRRDASELSPATRQFVQQELLPMQQRTHDSLSVLKSQL